jgi:transcriptional regulator with XRE-family HTH domain
MDRAQARATLSVVGRSPVDVLRALRAELNLSDFAIGEVAGRSAQTVRRWRRAESGAEVPEEAAATIEGLRKIVAMLLPSGFEGTTIKGFLLSRNVGLGKDRPLDGLRPAVGAFRRVEHVAECFAAGIAPEPGPPLLAAEGGDST